MTTGEAEMIISQEVCKISHASNGRGPEKIQCKLIDDMILIKLIGNLSYRDKLLIKSENGHNLLKECRYLTILSFKDLIGLFVKKILDVELKDICYDLSRSTYEEIIVFCFDNVPKIKNKKQ